MKDGNFQVELEEIKLYITKFIYNLFLFLSLAASSVSIFSLLILKKDYTRENIPILLIITLLITIIIFLIRIKLNLKNYKRAVILIVLILFSLALVYSYLRGTLNFFEFPLMITAIIVSSILVNLKFTNIISYLSLGIYIIISLLESFNIIKYVSVPTSSDVFDTVIILIFVLVILNISRIGYGQIEKSYKKALQYSKELEILNIELDNRVKDRTKILQDNFDKQIESMYTTAIIGNIAKPLLHDIATPISALAGVIDLIQRKSKYDHELIEAAKESVNQINTIILESRELIRGKDLIQIFEINETIQKVFNILKSELQKDDIEINFKKKKKYKIKGIVSLFERIIINLLVNAIEELKNKKEKRIINIIVLEIDTKVIKIIIEDNGRGIDRNSQNNIFREDFTLKDNSYNLGLGLPFVKKTIEDKFNGSISIESLVNQYCKFILTFNLYYESKQTNI